MSNYHCPNCGGRNFRVEVKTVAEVQFAEDDDHEVLDCPVADLEFGDESWAVCGNCEWGGTLRTMEVENAAKAEGD